MTRIDEAVDELGSGGHGAVEGSGDLADGHLPARSQLKQNLYLRGRQAVGVAESGDCGEEGFGDDGQQLDTGFYESPLIRSSC
jgi:hypothetical protein